MALAIGLRQALSAAAYVDRILKRGNPADRRAEAIPGNG